MIRRYGLATAALSLASGVAFVAWSLSGCAVSAPADLTPDIDPNLPKVEAPNDPAPMPSSSNDDVASNDAGASLDDASEHDSDTGDSAKADVGSDDASAPPVPPSTAIPKPTVGEVLISEVMYDTLGPEPASEWIELYGNATSARALTGLTLKDGAGRTHVIGAGVVLLPGTYVVLARSNAGALAAKVPASVIAYEYGTGLADTAGVLLANGTSGAVSLLSGSTIISAAPYGAWFNQSGGRSVQLEILDAAQAGAKASWCLSQSAWAAGAENGTPGAASDCL